MANLKELRASITSVKSTKRITSAMKMVAAAKLKRATDSVEASRSYSSNMAEILSNVAKGSTSSHPLLVGTGTDKTHLLIVVSSDRGLCGGFNGNLAKKVSAHIKTLKNSGKTVKLVLVGRKGISLLRRQYDDMVIKTFEDLNKPSPDYSHAETVSCLLLDMMSSNNFDVCTLYYNRSVSALEQIPTPIQLMPLHTGDTINTVDTNNNTAKNNSDTINNTYRESNVHSESEVYSFEPSEEAILENLLPKNITVQVYGAMLESFAAEQAARMTAMDNATRNASDMITTLSTKYNRTRQAQITKELIEIISGAEAL